MRNLFVLLCFLHVMEGNAQHSLNGTITDSKTNSPLIGVTVFIHDIRQGAVSDLNGHYSINDLPKGKFLVEISYPEYRSKAIPVIITGATILNIRLQETVTEFNEVVVTGSSRATDIRKNPMSIITTDKLQMNRSISTNLIDAVAKLPGISSVNTGPNISKPVIRGLGNNRILTLYNGIRQEGQQWGDEHGIEIDEYSIDRVEILKGPASLIYGSDALAGVINLLPKKPFPEGQIRGSLLSNYQSNNGLIGLSAAVSGTTGGWIWGSRISHKQAKNYQNKNDGRVYGTSFNEYDASGFAGLNKKWGFLHVHFTVYDNTQGVPDGSRDSISRKFTRQITESDSIRIPVSDSELNAYSIPGIHQHIQHYRVYLSNQLILSKGRLSFNLGYQQSIRREYAHPEYLNTPGLFLTLKTYTYDFKYFLPESGTVENTLGVNGMFQSNTDAGTEFIIPNFKQFDFGPFICFKKSLDQLDLSAGLRYDVRSFHNDAMYTITDNKTGFDFQVNNMAGANTPFKSYNHLFTGLSGSFGATYLLNENLSFKANLSRGFRAPNISEISSNGVHPGTSVYQIGNATFQPEFSLQEDLGLFFSTKHLSGSVEVFNNQISHFIYNEKLQTNGHDSVDASGNSFFQYKQVNARLFGGEVSLDIHPHPLDWLHIENSLSMVYALKSGNTNDSSRYLPFIPPLHTRSELRADFKNINKSFSSAYIKLEVEYFAPQHRVLLANNTETITPGYSLFNVGFGSDWITGEGKPLASIQLLCANVLDLAYQSNMSRLKYMDNYPMNATGRTGIYNMGRNFSVKVIIPFGN